MAYNDFFGEIDNCLGVSPIGVMRHTVAGAGDPVVIYAVGAIPVSVTFVDALVHCTATQGGGTFTIETAIGGAGAAAMTDAIVCAVIDVPTRAALMVAAQAVVGPADAVQVNKAAANNEGLVYLMFHLT